jgi:dTDP-glucose pyrophosphorylase/CBS domain-containing protein
VTTKSVGSRKLDTTLPAPSGPRLSDLLVPLEATLLEALRVMDATGKAIVFVRNSDGRVLGSLTDGDIRRALIGGEALDARCVGNVMRRDFVSVTEDVGRADVLELMQARGVEQIPVLNRKGELCGLHTMRQLIAPAQRSNFALILAGGRGTRLLPLTEHVPKPMLTVAGRPILERLVLHLMGQGFRHIYIAVNYLAEVIVNHFGDGSRYGCTIEYIMERHPLGTAGALALLPTPVTESVLVINGDLVTQCDLASLVDYHERGGFAATIGLRPHSVIIPYGVAEVSEGRLVGLREKPTERMLINAGVYAVSPQAIELIPRDKDFPMTDLLSLCSTKEWSVGAHLIEDDWVDVGHPSELQIARGHI